MNKKLITILILGLWMIMLLQSAYSQVQKKPKNTRFEELKKLIKDKSKQLKERASKISQKTKQTVKQSRTAAKASSIKTEQNIQKNKK